MSLIENAPREQKILDHIYFFNFKSWKNKSSLNFFSKAPSERSYYRFVRFLGQKGDKIQISPLQKDLERIQDHFDCSRLKHKLSHFFDILMRF